MARRIVVYCCLLWSCWSIAASELTVIDNNGVALLDNRFRIDHKVDELTLIFSRAEGQPPVILVRPDGSKIYSWKPPEHVRWSSSATQDFVTIEDPMRGPWQAVGGLIHGPHRISLVSKLSLVVDAIPEKLFIGERIRIKAHLQLADGQLVNESYVRAINVSARLLQSNLTDADADYGYGKVALGDLVDDGRFYDEVPQDGVLTSQLALDAPGGVYRLYVETANDVFSRAYEQDVVLYPAPIEVSVDTTAEFPVMVLRIDREDIAPDTVIIDGLIESRTGEQWPVQWRADKDSGVEPHIPLPDLGGYGVFNLMLNAYVDTREEGRSAQVRLVPISFRLNPPPEPEPTIASAAVAAEPPQPVAESGIPVWLIAVIAGIALLLVLVLIIFLLKRRSLKRALAQQELTLKE